MQVFN